MRPFIGVVAVLLVACAMPSTTVRTPDNRPSLVIAGAPPDRSSSSTEMRWARPRRTMDSLKCSSSTRDAPGRRARHCGQAPLRADRLRRKRDEDHPGA